MSYKNTLIEIAPDATNTTGLIPKPRGQNETKVQIEFRLLIENPYAFTQDELIFAIALERENIDEQKLSKAERQKRWDDMFTKPHPCMRASSLTKKHGWGAHYNHEGRIALVEVGSQNYQRLLNDEGVVKHKAMRSKKSAK